MTNKEVMKLFAVLETEYSGFNSKLSNEEYAGRVQLWTEMFADEPYEIVGAAVKAFIATDTGGYPPSIGKIKAVIVKMQEPDQMSEQEAVNRIMAAARNGIYGAKEEFDKLPPILQKLVGSPAQLRDWGIMDAATANSVVASNLRASYRTVVKREKELAAIPCSVREKLDTYRLLEARDEKDGKRTEIRQIGQ